MTISIVNMNEPEMKPKIQQQKNDTSTIARFKRGECASAINSMVIATTLSIASLLAFIGYIIYVYGYNNGNWTPGSGDTVVVG
jgi:hypothetical protein